MPRISSASAMARLWRLFLHPRLALIRNNSTGKSLKNPKSSRQASIVYLLISPRNKVHSFSFFRGGWREIVYVYSFGALDVL